MNADSKSVLLLTKVEMYTVAAALTDYLENDQGEPNNRSDEVHDLATARDTEISLDGDAVKDLLRKVTERADNLHTLLPPHLIVESADPVAFPTEKLERCDIGASERVKHICKLAEFAYDGTDSWRLIGVDLAYLFWAMAAHPDDRTGWVDWRDMRDVTQNLLLRLDKSHPVWGYIKEHPHEKSI